MIRAPRVRPFRVIAALVLALLAAAWPWLALPSLAIVILVAAQESGAPRRLTVIIGGLAVTVAMVRFVAEIAAPNVVRSGQFAAEEKAVSRLREILWAENRTRMGAWADSNGDGRGEYALLGEMVALAPTRDGVSFPVPVLRPARFRPVHGGAEDGSVEWKRVLRSEGYLFIVYLPGPDGGAVHEVAGGRTGTVDATAASRRFIAYAWPEVRGRGGDRTFYIDQDDRICEAAAGAPYSGTTAIPPPFAALQARRFDAPACGAGSDGAEWKPWRNKRPRAASPAQR